jgi:hypothetical protein
MEYRNGRNINYRHPITICTELSRMYGSVNAVEHQHDDEEEEQNHPYDDDAVIGFYHE